jgi:hypothetical protein
LEIPSGNGSTAQAIGIRPSRRYLPY